MQRITMKTVNEHMQRSLTTRYNDLAKLQEQLSTGKRLLRPSDDPVDVANDLKLRTKGSELSQFKKNIDDGLAFMNVSGTAMDSMNTLFQRMRELAVQGSSDTIGSQERVYLNKEVEQLFRQVIALVNTSHKGDFVFGGTQTKIPPYDVSKSSGSTVEDYNTSKMAYFNAAGLPAGSTVQLLNGFDNTPITNIIPGAFQLSVQGKNFIENVDYKMDYEKGTITLTNPALLADVTPGSANYNINEFSIRFDYISRGKDVYGSPVSNLGEIHREIESGITMPINIAADEMLTDNRTGMTSISAIIQFGQSLIQNNGQGIQNAIDNLDKVFSAVLSAESKNGARINRFETTGDRNGQQQTNTTAFQSTIEDADMAETITRFSLTENVYNAALKSAARVIQPSLVNFL